MYDQLGGGFARYSVDADWVVPHFEKMLYDNALLARVYAHWWRRTGDRAGPPAWPRETCDWMIARPAHRRGRLRRALDADSDGTEARSTSGRRASSRTVLGAEDGQYAAELFEVTQAGTFEHGRSVLQLPADPR